MPPVPDENQSPFPRESAPPAAPIPPMMHGEPAHEAPGPSTGTLIAGVGIGLGVAALITGLVVARRKSA